MLLYRGQNETSLNGPERRIEAQKMIFLRPAAVFTRYDPKNKLNDN